MTGVELETQLTPSLHIRDPFAPRNVTTAGRILKPKITIQGPLYSGSFAPWGEPSPLIRAAVGIGVAITLGGLVYYAIKGWRA